MIQLQYMVKTYSNVFSQCYSLGSWRMVFESYSICYVLNAKYLSTLIGFILWKITNGAHISSSTSWGANNLEQLLDNRVKNENYRYSGSYAKQDCKINIQANLIELQPQNFPMDWVMSMQRNYKKRYLS